MDERGLSADFWRQCSEPLLQLSLPAATVLSANAAAQEWRQLGAWERDAGALEGRSWLDGLSDADAQQWRLALQLTQEQAEHRWLWSRLVLGQPRAWSVVLQRQASASAAWVWAHDLSIWQADERERERQESARRDLLVRELHHRLKNNLQGVAGLLEQLGRGREELQPALKQASGQLHAIAQVYGLHVQQLGPLTVVSMLQALAETVARLFGKPVRVKTVTEGGPSAIATAPGLPDAGANTEPEGLRQALWAHLEAPVGTPAAPAIALHDWRVREDDASALALSINELLTNAVKHSRAADGGVSCSCRAEADGVCVEIRNKGTLAPSSVSTPRAARLSGLDLVQGLLPRRSTRFSLAAEGTEVVARLHIRPPTLTPGDDAHGQSRP